MRFGILLVTAAAVAATAMPGAASAQVTGVQPGQWDIAVSIDTMVMAGAPAGIANAMRGKVTHVKQCITPQDAARGPQEMMKANKSCTFTRYSMAGGKLDSAMTCRQGGGTITSVSSGSFTPTAFTIKGRTVGTGPMAMTMTTTSVGRRVGACGK